MRLNNLLSEEEKMFCEVLNIINDKTVEWVQNIQ